MPVPPVYEMPLESSAMKVSSIDRELVVVGDAVVVVVVVVVVVLSALLALQSTVKEKTNSNQCDCYSHWRLYLFLTPALSILFINNTGIFSLFFLSMKITTALLIELSNEKDMQLNYITTCADPKKYEGGYRGLSLFAGSRGGGPRPIFAIVIMQFKKF